MLKRNKPKDIRKAIEQLLNDNTYKENANKISKGFKLAGGAKKAADVILNIINNAGKIQQLTKINPDDIINEIIIKTKKRSSKYIGIVQREDGWCESSQSIY